MREWFIVSKYSDMVIKIAQVYGVALTYGLMFAH